MLAHEVGGLGGVVDLGLGTFAIGGVAPFGHDEGLFQPGEGFSIGREALIERHISQECLGRRGPVGVEAEGVEAAHQRPVAQHQLGEDLAVDVALDRRDGEGGADDRRIGIGGANRFAGGQCKGEIFLHRRAGLPELRDVRLVPDFPDRIERREVLHRGGGPSGEGRDLLGRARRHMGIGVAGIGRIGIVEDQQRPDILRGERAQLEVVKAPIVAPRDPLGRIPEQIVRRMRMPAAASCATSSGVAVNSRICAATPTPERSVFGVSEVWAKPAPPAAIQISMVATIRSAILIRSSTQHLRNGTADGRSLAQNQSSPRDEAAWLRCMMRDTGSTHRVASVGRRRG